MKLSLNPHLGAVALFVGVALASTGCSAATDDSADGAEPSETSADELRSPPKTFVVEVESTAYLTGALYFMCAHQNGRIQRAHSLPSTRPATITSFEFTDEDHWLRVGYAGWNKRVKLEIVADRTCERIVYLDENG